MVQEQEIKASQAEVVLSSEVLSNTQVRQILVVDIVVILGGVI